MLIDKEDEAVAMVLADGDATRRDYVRSGVEAGDDRELFGRSRELAALDRLVEGGARLVTVTGAAGIGKTRLVERWAHRHRAPLVDLSSARTIEEVTALLARALALPLASGDAVESIASLATAVAARGATTVVFDNLEQLVASSSAFLKPFLDASVLVVATSRERLRLRDERVLELTPLSIEDGAALFIERARRAREGARIDHAAAAAIVARLDGMPLAIELAAARAGVLTPPQILARLDRQLDLLASGARDVPARHATLRAALAWSWELLAFSEQRALAQCSVFRGAFTLEAAEAVLDRGALDAIQSLRDKSLVHVVGARDAIRYKLLVSVRELAEEKLAPVDRAAAYARHADYFLSIDPRQLASVDAEAAEIFAVAERALEGDVDEGAALGALAVLEPLVIACASGRLALFADLLDRAIAAFDAPPDRVFARAVYARAFVDLLRGRAECAAGFQRSLEAARVAKARDVEARSLAKLGLVYEHMSNASAAKAHLDEARAIAVDEDDPALLADHDLARGGSFAWRSFPAEAVEHYGAALARFEAIGDEDGACLSEIALADVLLNLARYEEAEHHGRRALAGVERNAPRRAHGYVVCVLARLAQARREFEAARALYDRAIEVHRAVGDRWQEGMTYGLRAQLEHETGDLDLAARGYALALDLFATTNERECDAFFAAGLAACCEGLGRHALAATHFADAHRRASGADSQVTRAIVALFASVDRASDLARARLRLESPCADGAAPLVARSELVRFALRSIGTAAPASSSRLSASSPPLVVGGAARWFRFGDAAPVALDRSRAARLILHRLVRARLDSPGEALSLEDLFAAGWPGEKIGRASAANRVYVTLHKLKSLGLRALLKSRDDGFLLDPAAPVVEAIDRASAEPSSRAV